MNFSEVPGYYTVEVEVSTDAEAIAASVEQPDEFVVIFDCHFQAVYRFLARRFGPDAAPDLAAETFTRAFEGRGRYRPQTPSALPWLFGIAIHVAANERRREARQLRAYATVASREPAQDEAGGIDQFGGAREEFLSALGQLKPQDRDALLLFAWGDLAYAEIAEALGIPVGTVRSRISRARRRLRDVMSPDAPEALTEGRYDGV